jgi:hypothetical protein
MARTLLEIKKELTAAFMSKAIIQTSYGFVEGALFDDEFSKASFESIFFDVFAYCTLILEQIFDQHKKEVDTALYEQKSGTPRWYGNMALAFQYGFDLLADSDKFDNTGFTVDQIDASKIIKYRSVKESGESNRLVVKVAGESAGELIPLTTLQLDSFDGYMEEIKYAGVKLQIVNNPADQLLLNMAIYRDVLVIDENGNSILNGGKPVETAVNAYIKNLPFDGELVLNDLIEKLRAVDGVDNAHIIVATSSIYDTVTLDYRDYAPINVKTIPVAGYFEVPNFDTVTYVV